jgi:hypothetical protein
MQQIRYTALLTRLAKDFPDAPANFWPQTLNRWRKVLGIEQPKPGWYDEEDYIGLQALGEAYRRHGLRGDDAREYALNKIQRWRITHGYQH